MLRGISIVYCPHPVAVYNRGRIKGYVDSSDNILVFQFLQLLLSGGAALKFGIFNSSIGRGIANIETSQRIEAPPLKGLELRYTVDLHGHFRIR